VALLALPAVILGGLTSVGGTLLASFLMAALATLSTYSLGVDGGAVASWSALIVVLVVRPNGLFGSVSSARL
jgi:branched-chain amino acid transport system permease protein